MSNSSSATKMAIAQLRGSDLPTFVPASIAKDLANRVRLCILQSKDSKRLKITSRVYEELAEHISQHQSPKYTISQYLLILLHTVTTTSDLINQHDLGLIADKEFIKQIKNDKNNNGAKKPSKMGRKKGEANASDRAVLPSEIQQGADTKVS